MTIINLSLIHISLGRLRGVVVHGGVIDQQLFLPLAAARHTEALVFVGLPLAIDGELYNVAAALNDGKTTLILFRVVMEQLQENQRRLFQI